MAYTSGMMNRRVAVGKKQAATTGAFGRNSGGVTYALLGEYWASVDFVRGLKAMREEALDAFDTVMIRMRYNAEIDRDCLFVVDGKCYGVQSLHQDYQQNIIQVTATELPDKDISFAG